MRRPEPLEGPPFPGCRFLGVNSARVRHRDTVRSGPLQMKNERPAQSYLKYSLAACLSRCT